MRAEKSLATTSRPKYRKQQTVFGVAVLGAHWLANSQHMAEQAITLQTGACQTLNNPTRLEPCCF